MAYIARTRDEEKEEGELEEGNALTGALPARASSAAPAAAPATGNTDPGTGSDFVSFDRYYDANADASKNYANQLTTQATNTANTAQGNIDRSTEDFETATVGRGQTTRPAFPTSTTAEQEATPRAPRPRAAKTDDSWRDTIITQADRDIGAVGTTVEEAQAKANPKPFEIGSLLDAQFGGQKLADDIEHANQQVGALQTPEGIQAAMHGASDGGVSDSLDAALVNRAGGTDFRALKNKYGSLTKLLDDRVKYSTGLANQARTNQSREKGRYQRALDAYYAGQAQKSTNEANAPLPGTRAPLPGEKDLRGPEVKVSAEEDAQGTSALVAQIGPILLQAMGTAAGGQLGAAGVGAALAGNQAWANATAAEQKAAWDQWSAEAEAKWNREHPNGPPYQRGMTYAELTAESKPPPSRL